MELVDAPAYAPAVCCLTNKGGPLIDTQRQVVNFGRAYLDPELVKDAARALGLVDIKVSKAKQRETQEREEAFAHLNEQYIELAEKYDELRSALCELLQHGAMADRQGIVRFRAVKTGQRRVKE